RPEHNVRSICFGKHARIEAIFRGWPLPAAVNLEACHSYRQRSDYLLIIGGAESSVTSLSTEKWGRHDAICRRIWNAAQCQYQVHSRRAGGYHMFVLEQLLVLSDC